MKKNIIAATALVLSLCYTSCFAGEIDVHFFGFSYHFDKNGAKKDAPNRLDRNDQLIFNPGMGMGYDFRESIKKEGFSPVTLLGFFQNCSNSPFFFGGGGLRYRKFVIGKLFWEANALGIFACGKDWDENSFIYGVMPYANTGFGYDFGGHLMTLLFGYAPKNSGNSITNGTDMLFVSLEVSF
ncbi:MAG: hypothetical protein PHG87_05180 [Candidatus Omnitrophica bacterium]|nr:hypothetical protein [Candidatus Omnitrophota bacterium]